ncbi:type II toxin-antitoxin system RelB/DinJ family antitoxin [Brevundimonas sp.]|uniref:type II toxin-antitoxin system RelB/DinJ family antitoxin n=1 Tax=Brevundimonas sp. TaxID=1871086 RepID=UPI002ABAE89C|nr:type II toxin-antitoxin system RelB/DinJ family antitoxin [Brevundimonas sp.]MDZ4363441.1 type II toxin-antitoxin system RelB/DinJ family antitoxin [Brevundimonas sp.]
MAKTAMRHIRMDEELKAEGNAALALVGLSAADAVRLLYHRIVADQAFPLELKVPNAETLGAMAEIEAMRQWDKQVLKPPRSRVIAASETSTPTCSANKPIHLANRPARR